jgi:hypothetical protein
VIVLLLVFTGVFLIDCIGDDDNDDGKVFVFVFVGSAPKYLLFRVVKQRLNLSLIRVVIYT